MLNRKKLCLRIKLRRGLKCYKGGRGVGGRGVGDGSVESAPMAANIPSFLGMLM